jgi:heme exporter protein A
MPNTILICNNLTYSIGYKKLFHNLNFQISQGDKILLTGENGSGKSTLLNLLLQYKKDKAFQFFPQSKNPMSYLGHQNGYYSTLTLKQNLNFFNSILPEPGSVQEIENLVNLFGLTNRLEDSISSFSEGMKKKTGIIRALLAKPSLLILDEPFNSLDIKSVSILENYLGSDKNFQALLLVSHNPVQNQKIGNRNWKIFDKQILDV